MERLEIEQLERVYFLDLAGLKRYDENIKSYIAEKIAESSVSGASTMKLNLNVEEAETVVRILNNEPVENCAELCVSLVCKMQEMQEAFEARFKAIEDAIKSNTGCGCNGGK